MASSDLMGSAGARAIGVITVVGILGSVAWMSMTSTQSAMLQIVRDLQTGMQTRYGGSGNYTDNSTAQDITSAVVNSQNFPRSLRLVSVGGVDSLVHADGGTVQLNLEQATRNVTLTGLTKASCTALIEGMDTTRDFQGACIGSTCGSSNSTTTILGTQVEPITRDRLRGLAVGCAGNDTVTFKWRQ